jgi:hypothetical protein
MCDGPIRFIGDSVNTLDPVPPAIRSAATFSKVEMPYASKLYMQELEFFLNISSRHLTTYEPTKLHGLRDIEGRVADETEDISMPLPTRVFAEISVPEMRVMNANINIEGAMQGLFDVEKEKGLNEKEETKDNKEVKEFVIPIVEERKEGEEAQSNQPPPSILKKEEQEVKTDLPPSPFLLPSPLQKQEQEKKTEIQAVPDEPTNAPLIMVDTSEPAMIAEGLQEIQKAGPGRPVGTTKRRVEIKEGGSSEKEPEEKEERVQYNSVVTVEKME